MPDQVQNKKLRQFTLLRIIWRCHHVAWHHAPYEKQYESHWYAGLLREKRKGHAHVSAEMQRDHEIRPLRTEKSAKEVAAALVTPHPNPINCSNNVRPASHHCELCLPKKDGTAFSFHC